MTRRVGGDISMEQGGDVSIYPLLTISLYSIFYYIYIYNFGLIEKEKKKQKERKCRECRECRECRQKTKLPEIRKPI